MLALFSKAFLNNSRSSVSKYLISENVTRITLVDSLKRFASTKPRCNVGTIGHVDHGKTTLSSAITKVMAKDGNAKFMAYDAIDKSPEEKARGITINACHLGYSSENRSYAHVDCPGHHSFIKNMIAGTSQMDGAILVVAASDGIMPQTREHILLTKLIGVKDIVVYINKADLADDEMLQLVEMEVSELLDEVGYDSTKVPFICGSALCALNGDNPEIGEKSIRELVRALDEYVELPERKKQGQFVMPVDASFNVKDKGTVAVGAVTHGTLRRGDSIHILGNGREIKTIARELQVFQENVPSVVAGDDIGILLKGVRKEFVERGSFICTVDPAKGPVPIQTECIISRCYVMTKEEGGRSKPIMSGFTSMMFVGTWNASCYIELLSPNSKEVQEFKEAKEFKETNDKFSNVDETDNYGKKDKSELIAMGGDMVFAKIYINRPMILEKGQKFFIREMHATVLTGMVTQIRPDDYKQIKGFNWLPPKKPIYVVNNQKKQSKK